MIQRLVSGACLTATAVLAGTMLSASAQPNQPLVGNGGQEFTQGEILTRGPIHEAYAEAVQTSPEPGMIVPTAPPESIEEMPPDQRPAEGEAIWIPGYWAWDDDREEFIWISGVWRLPPPGAEWVPGYWDEVANGHQWVSGYWWSREQGQGESSEVVYLPEPPRTLEVGPSSPTPTDQHFWVPGCWHWREVRYVWRPGYWAAGVPEWVWIPARYVWTPGGYLFVPGHWDYTLDRRGLVFAPVYFGPIVYTRPVFRYVPTVVINTTVLHTTLFVRPHYCHYYFGDYYATTYRDRGIVAWFTFHEDRRGYDPLFAYHHWRHGRDRSWLSRLHETYEYRRVHEEARPPKTYRAMRERIAEKPADRTFRLAAGLNEVEEIKDLPIRLTRVEGQQRERHLQTKNEFREFVHQRAKLEQQLVEQDKTRPERARGALPEAAGIPTADTRQEPKRVKLPETPLARLRSDRGHGETAVDRRGAEQSVGRRSSEQPGRAKVLEGRNASEQPGASQPPHSGATPQQPQEPAAIPGADRRQGDLRRGRVEDWQRERVPRMGTELPGPAQRFGVPGPLQGMSPARPGTGDQPPGTDLDRSGFPSELRSGRQPEFDRRSHMRPEVLDKSGGSTLPGIGGEPPTAKQSPLPGTPGLQPGPQTSQQQPAIRPMPQQPRGQFDRSLRFSPQITPGLPSGSAVEQGRSSARMQIPQQQAEANREERGRPSFESRAGDRGSRQRGGPPPERSRGRGEREKDD